MTCRSVRQPVRPAVAWCRPLPIRSGTSEQTRSKHSRGRSCDLYAPAASSELGRRSRATEGVNTLRSSRSLRASWVDSLSGVKDGVRRENIARTALTDRSYLRRRLALSPPTSPCSPRSTPTTAPTCPCGTTCRPSRSGYSPPPSEHRSSPARSGTRSGQVASRGVKRGRLLRMQASRRQTDSELPAPGPACGRISMAGGAVRMIRRRRGRAS